MVYTKGHDNFRKPTPKSQRPFDVLLHLFVWGMALVRDTFGIINLGDKMMGLIKNNLGKLPGRECRVICKTEKFLRIANRN